MANMSYCRFRNTLEALRDCVDWMSDQHKLPGDLLDEEARALKRLIELCRDVAGDYTDEETGEVIL